MNVQKTRRVWTVQYFVSGRKEDFERGGRPKNKVSHRNGGRVNESSLWDVSESIRCRLGSRFANLRLLKLMMMMVEGEGTKSGDSRVDMIPLSEGQRETWRWERTISDKLYIVGLLNRHK